MSDEAPQATRGSWEIQAVSRAAQILGLLGPHRERVDAQVVAALTGLNRTTAHRYLMSMEGAGLLARAEAGFGVGPLVAQLGAHHVGSQELLRVAPPYMRDLADRARLTCALSVRGVDGATIVHVEEDTSFDGLVLSVPIGARLDALSAHGQVWAAFTGARFEVGHDRRPPSAEVRERVAALLEETRETGVGMRATEESVFVAIAAPIRAGGEVVAALSLLGTPTTLPPERDGRAAGLLLETVAAIGEALAR